MFEYFHNNTTLEKLHIYTNIMIIFLVIYLREMKIDICLQRILYKNIYSSFIHISKELKKK